MLDGYYLAHATDSRREIREWELGFEARTRIDLINPFYDVDRPDIMDLDAGVEIPRIISAEEIVERDLGLIIGARRGLVVIVDQNYSIGKFMEMVYAHIWGKNVYSIVTNGQEDHQWIGYHSNKIFLTREDFEQFLKPK